MKGMLSLSNWSISHMGGQSYLAERIIDGKLQLKNINAHCLACAKTDILAKFGGKVDTRGWHFQGICGSFLYAMAKEVMGEEEKGCKDKN